MTTAEQIKTWRAGRTLEQAAREIGVTTSTLHRWEKGAEPGGLGRKALERAGCSIVVHVAPGSGRVANVASEPTTGEQAERGE